MVFEKLVGSISKHLNSDVSDDLPMNQNEFSQGITLLNTRHNLLNELKPKLNLVANYEGFSTKPLDDVNKKELKIIQNMKTQFDANLSAYSRQYRSFMSNYTKYADLVLDCKKECNSKYPSGSNSWNDNQSSCKAGCELKGPYASKCQDRYESTDSNLSCALAESEGICSGGIIIPGQEVAANNQAKLDTKYGNTYASGCCVCGGGSGGPPHAIVNGNKIQSCGDIWKSFGYNKPNYTVDTCKKAPYASPQGAADLWKEYQSLVNANANLMQLSQHIYSKINKLTTMDNKIKQQIKAKQNFLKNQLNTFDTTYANLKNIETQATLTTQGILEDIHLRNKAMNLRFYPWAVLAVSGLAIAIYQINKA